MNLRTINTDYLRDRLAAAINALDPTQYASVGEAIDAVILLYHDLGDELAEAFEVDHCDMLKIEHCDASREERRQRLGIRLVGGTDAPPPL